MHSLYNIQCIKQKTLREDVHDFNLELKWIFLQRLNLFAICISDIIFCFENMLSVCFLATSNHINHSIVQHSYLTYPTLFCYLLVPTHFTHTLYPFSFTSNRNMSTHQHTYIAYYDATLTTHVPQNVHHVH